MKPLYQVQPLPAGATLRASIRPPGSKSITNRACICAALGTGTSRLTGPLHSEDTEVMVAALRALGLRVETTADTFVIEGGGGSFPNEKAELYCANSGTSIRFLTAALGMVGGDYQLDGIERMRARPIADLVDALQQLGGDVTAATGCPPVSVAGDGVVGGEASIRGDISSQFLSGLMMGAPAAPAEVRLRVEGELVSKPYVVMTRRVMEAFGARVQCGDAMQHFSIAPTGYIAADYAIEPDASAASYFWAAAAIAGGEATVEGLNFDALQGDVQFCRVLEQMGCDVTERKDGISVRGPAVGSHGLRGVDVDMNAISDTVQTLAAVALFANGPTTVRGVAHNRHKETDRIGDLACELRKLGANVEEADDGMTILPPQAACGAEIETYNDHRMAMSLALAGLRTPGVVIRDPQCTGKTYPHFWDDLESLCQQIEESQ